MKSIKAVHEQVLLKPYKEPKAESVLIIPDSAKEADSYYEVVNVGSEVAPLSYGVEDIVICNPYAGRKLLHDGQEYLLTHYENILAVVE